MLDLKDVLKKQGYSVGKDGSIIDDDEEPKKPLDLSDFINFSLLIALIENSLKSLLSNTKVIFYNEDFNKFKTYKKGDFDSLLKIIEEKLPKKEVVQLDQGIIQQEKLLYH